MTGVPHGLQAHADKALNKKGESWHQIEVLWTYMQQHCKPACDMLKSRGARKSSELCPMIVEDIRAAKDAMAKQGSNRGARALSRTAPTAKRNGQAESTSNGPKRAASQPARAPKGAQQPTLETLVGADEMFWYKDELNTCHSAPTFDIEDIDPDTLGLSVSS